VLFDTFVAQSSQLGVTEQDRTAIRQGAPLAPEKQKALLAALRKAADAMQRQYGAIEVPWGNVRRVARGQLSFPVAGGGVAGISTLRAVSFDAPNEKGERVGAGGQFMTTLVVFKKTGAESYSATPWGQSDDPDSAHFADQAEKLFSRKALKPTWFDKKQLMPHIASSKTLEM
jgi:acyl-homoserine-lactone acylase